MLRRRDVGRYVFGWLLTALIAMGILLPLLDLLNLADEARYALRAVLVFTLFAQAVPRLRPAFRLPVRLLGAALFVLLAAKGTLAFLRAIMATPSLQTAVFLYSDTVTLLLALIMSLFGLLLQSGEAAFGAPMILAAALMLWMSGAKGELIHYLPSALSVPLLFAYAHPRMEDGVEQKTSGATMWRYAVPAALIALLIAFLLTPAQRTSYPPLEKRANELRQWINDRFFFTDSRQAFSLRGEGWQPMGDEGLGGVPQVPDTPVMEVTAQEKTYLRGSIRDRYNGRGWYDTISKDRYGYNSPRFTALREELMDAHLPKEGAFPLETAEVHILRDGTSTLLIPQRTRELIPGSGLVPYFNRSSEVFVTRNLKAGDSYTVRYENYVAGDKLRRLAKNLQAEDDARYAAMQAQYALLPDHLTGDSIVAKLAKQYAGGAQAPYEMAENIMRGLQKDYKYTLDVPKTPTDIDFAAHFLFQSRQGYCTYFATAMVVLARSVGLPARYVEGFVADGGGTPQILTSKNAHAWAEVYIPSVGWVVFDATAPFDENGQEKDDDEQNGEQDHQPPEVTATPEPNEDEQEPEPSPSPTDEPPMPSPQPSPSPKEADENAETPKAQKGGSFPWLLLLLAALSVWRALAVDPKRQEKKIADPTERLLLWWKAYANVHAAGGRAMEDSETMEAYAYRIAPEDEEVLELAKEVSAVVYGKKQSGEDAARVMRGCFERALKALPLNQKAAYYVKRLLFSKQEIRRVLRRA